jgi:hypothetical protein
VVHSSLSADRSSQGARNTDKVWMKHGTRFAPRHRPGLSQTLAENSRRTTIPSRLPGRLEERAYSPGKTFFLDLRLGSSPEVKLF